MSSGPRRRSTRGADIAKIPATADQIQQELRRRIQLSAREQPRCAACKAPRPVPLEEPRGDGVTWSVDGFSAVPSGCAAFMMKILSEVMFAYDLVDPGAPARRRPRGSSGRERREQPQANSGVAGSETANPMSAGDESK